MKVLKRYCFYNDLSAQNTYIKIKRAKEVLLDPETRKAYDLDMINYSNALTLYRDYNYIKYTPSGLAEERDLLTKQVEFYNHNKTTSQTYVALNLKDFFFLLKNNEDFIKSALSLRISRLGLQYMASQNITKDDVVSIIVKSDTSFQESHFSCIDVNWTHQLSSSYAFTLSTMVGSRSNLSASITKKFFKDLSCTFTLELVPLHGGRYIVLAYRLAFNTFKKNLSTGIYISELSPPSIVFYMSYLPREDLLSKFFVKTGIEKKSVGLSLKYNILDNLYTLGLSTKLLEMEPAINYSFFWNINGFQRFGTSICLSGSEGVYIKLKYKRKWGKLVVPIFFTDEITMISVMLTTFGSVLVTSFIYLAYNKTIKVIKKKKDSKGNDQEMIKLYKKKAQALEEIQVMMDTYEKVTKREKCIDGLVIVNATYAPFLNKKNAVYGPEVELVDVTIPMQCLVSDSKIQLPSGSKRSLLGFYQLETEEPLFLRVEYTFNGVDHLSLYNDFDPVLIPLRSHIIKSTNN